MAKFHKRKIVEWECKSCEAYAIEFCTTCRNPICENCDDYFVDTGGAYFHRACWIKDEPIDIKTLEERNESALVVDD